GCSYKTWGCINFKYKCHSQAFIEDNISSPKVQTQTCYRCLCLCQNIVRDGAEGIPITSKDKTVSIIPNPPINVLVLYVTSPCFTLYVNNLSSKHMDTVLLSLWYVGSVERS